MNYLYEKTQEYLMTGKNRNITQTLSGEIIEAGPIPISRNRLRANQAHRLFSIKAGMRITTVESPLEADAIYWAESNPDIISLCEQPLRVHKQIGNKPYFTFDLSIKLQSGREVLYEIKPESSLVLTDTGRLIPKNWEEVEAWALDNGYLVDLLTENNINCNREVIANWRRLLPFVQSAYKYPDKIFENQLLDLFKNINKVKLLYVFKQFSQHNWQSTLSFVGKLIHQGKLVCDLNEARLSPDTVVFLDKHTDLT